MVDSSSPWVVASVTGSVISGIAVDTSEVAWSIL